MSFSFRDGSAPPSVFSRWDTRWKLVTIFVASVAVLFLHHWHTCSLALMGSLGLLIAAGVGAVVILTRIGIVLLALLPTLIILPFTVDDGTRIAGCLLLRAGTIASLALLIVATATLSQTMTAAGRLGVPPVLVQVGLLAQRYSLQFFDELRRLRIALFTRAFHLRTSEHTFRTLGQSAGTLLVRGVDRSERVGDAMLARGFSGRYLSLAEFKTRMVDKVLSAVVTLFALGLLVWDRCT